MQKANAIIVESVDTTDMSKCAGIARVNQYPMWQQLDIIIDLISSNNSNIIILVDHAMVLCIPLSLAYVAEQHMLFLDGPFPFITSRKFQH